MGVLSAFPTTAFVCLSIPRNLIEGVGYSSLVGYVQVQDLVKKMPEEVLLTTVYVAAGQPEAEIIKGRLEVEGIPAMLRYESAGLIYGLTVDGLGQVGVQVPSSLAEKARQILGVGN